MPSQDLFKLFIQMFHISFVVGILSKSLSRKWNEKHEHSWISLMTYARKMNEIEDAIVEYEKFG